MLIVGDIGGTKTLLAIYDRAGAYAPIAQMEYRSANYPALDVMVREFLATSQRTVRAACFDVAGPVIRGRAHLTNLPWTVEAKTLRASLHLDEVFLLNDLQAIAYAVPRLRAEDLYTINAGKPDASGAIAVIAPGTGLGEAFLVWTNSGYLACSSEGGHASFAPTDERQAALWRYLNSRFGHVSVERVCSGQGITNIYDFLRNTDPALESTGPIRMANVALLGLVEDLVVCLGAGKAGDLDPVPDRDRLDRLDRHHGLPQATVETLLP